MFFSPSRAHDGDDGRTSYVTTPLDLVLQSHAKLVVDLLFESLHPESSGTWDLYPAIVAQPLLVESFFTNSTDLFTNFMPPDLKLLFVCGHPLLLGFLIDELQASFICLIAVSFTQIATC